MQVRKDAIRLTLPILMEQTFVMLLGVVNTIMAGRLGKEVISAIGMIDSINNIIIAFFSALAIGGTVIVAQNTGRMDIENAKKAAMNAIVSGMLIALAITVIMALFRVSIIQFVFTTADAAVLDNTLIYFGITLWTYPMIALTSIIFGILRGAGNTKTPMKISMVMNILNVISSYVLIYGIDLNNPHFHLNIPGFGIRGAAYGIALARILGAVMILVVLFRDFLQLNVRIMKYFRFDRKMLKAIFGLGLPSSVESLMFNGGKLITQVFVVGMGTASIAANSVSGSLFGLLNITGSALCIAATTMVGQFVGRKEYGEAKATLKHLVWLGTLCLIVLCALMFPFARSLASIYTKDQDVIDITVTLLKSAAIAMPLFWALSFIMPSGLKGGGDVKYTLGVSMVGMWVFRLSVGYLLAIPLKMGLLGIWIGMYIDWLVRAVLFSIRFKREKWIHTI